MKCDMLRTFGRVMRNTMGEYIDEYIGKDNELYRYYNNYLQPKMNLQDLKLRFSVYNQDFYGEADNIVHKTYYKRNKEVCKIIYGTKSGSIELIRVNDEFRGRGLGKQMLTYTIQDMRNNQLTRVYAIAKRNHPFWHNIYGGAFKINKQKTKQLSHNICYYYLEL
jgi:GNAT superfamily N-acetyltransferase